MRGAGVGGDSTGRGASSHWESGGWSISGVPTKVRRVWFLGMFEGRVWKVGMFEGRVWKVRVFEGRVWKVVHLHLLVIYLTAQNTAQKTAQKTAQNTPQKSAANTRDDLLEGPKSGGNAGGCPLSGGEKPC